MSHEMIGNMCPTAAELLAWLNEPSDGDRPRAFDAHVEMCSACQGALEQLCQGTSAETATRTDEDLWSDLRRRPPTDGWEAEPECADAAARAVAVGHESTTAIPPTSPRKPAPSPPLKQLGHYEILEQLGAGGMGVVYKARHATLDRIVALKVLAVERMNDAAAVARFEREMKAVARLKHPHIVAAYDADVADGTPFLVMEFLEGVDLRSLVHREGPLSAEKAVAYVLQAARGLQYIHEQGIVHRDVKPANLMLDQGETIKILDLGLARLATPTAFAPELTEVGAILGTVDYLAPEQAAGAQGIDGRADIYSLGCSLYYLLTGRAPYKGESALQKIIAHREEPIPSLHDVRPEIPAALENVFAKMAAKRPDDRYQTMAQVIAALEAPVPAPRGRRLALILGALLSLAAVIGLSLWFGRLPPRPAETIVFPPLEPGTHAGQEWDGNDLGMRFCWCPAGRFTMSSPKNEPGRTAFESPQVEVVLSQGFWLGKYEVTQDEWERLLGTRPSRFHGAATLPVENVTWAEATRFCEIFTTRQRQHGPLPESWECRLPTEAQWEYGCRAATTTPYHFGDAPNRLRDHAWYAENAEIRTHEVGLKKPNAWGLHDMHGNAWEWCRDWYHQDLPGGTDPEVAEPGPGRVIRGGGWDAPPALCRTAFRSGQKADVGGHLLGFRVAVVLLSPER